MVATGVVRAVPETTNASKPHRVNRAGLGEVISAPATAMSNRPQPAKRDLADPSRLPAMPAPSDANAATSAAE